jgi:hypothetical protein
MLFLFISQQCFLFKKGLIIQKMLTFISLMAIIAPRITCGLSLYLVNILNVTCLSTVVYRLS